MLENESPARKTSIPETNAKNYSKILPWAFLCLIILFIVLVRVRLLDFPLERDEGEYAYMGQLISQGIPPYSIAYNMKFPGTSVMYLILMALFGQTIQGIHLGFLVVNCATILMVFQFCRKIITDYSAVIAAGVYAVLSLNFTVYGFAAHATHFVVLAAIAGLLFLRNALEKDNLKSYLSAGVLLGLSVIMKQSGIFFLLFGGLYILYDNIRSRPITYKKFINLGIFSLGGLIPFFVTFLILYIAGVFDKFWFWTVKYASTYGTQVPLSAVYHLFIGNFSFVIDGYFAVWCFSALGLISVFFNPSLKKDKVFILLFAAFSFLSVCPGFYFRPHYFVTLLPAASILAGLLFDFLIVKQPVLLKINSRYIGAGLFIAALSVGVIEQKEYLFLEDNLAKLVRKAYGPSPFIESIEIAKFIESRSSVNDKIAVFGSEPQIFFYSNRHSATGYIYAYPLMEPHDYSLTMQKEMIKEVESSPPKLIVMVNIYGSWDALAESEKYILDWINNYTSEHYTLVGVADMISTYETIYKWDADARNWTVLSPYHLLIFERK